MVDISVTAVGAALQQHVLLFSSLGSHQDLF
jgi:hypothetical protein